jgi:hypothetical protein
MSFIQKRLSMAMKSCLMSAACVLMMMVSSPLLAEVPYWRVTVDRVTVVTNGSARRCTQLATQFLAFEQILQSLANLDSGYEPIPVAIYGITAHDAEKYFYSAQDVQKMQQGLSAPYSKTLPGRDFNMLAIVDDGNIEDPWQSVLLLHAQGILTNGPTRRYPMWYQLGVPNILNGLSIERDNSVLLNRDQPFEPVDDREVRKDIKYDLKTLLQADGRAFDTGGDLTEFVRRAREWAQFGLLTTPERRKSYLDLAKLMRQNTPAEEAVSETFMVSLNELSAQFESRAWRKEVKYRLPAPTQLPAIDTPTRVDAAELKTLLEVLGTRTSRAYGK